MNYKDGFNFEIYVGTLLDNSNIKTGKALTDFAEELHELLESTIKEYAEDNNIEDDYEASY